MELKISDLYVGKLDAKDEYNTDNKRFVENFIIPPNFDVNSIIKNNVNFIYGYKGTGKTALLYYIREKFIESKIPVDFIFFKSDYENITRVDEIITSGDSLNTSQSEYMEYISVWKIIFFVKIMDLNIDYDYSIFYNNKEWKKFIGQLGKILNFRKPNFFKNIVSRIRVKNIIEVENTCYSQEVSFDQSQDNEDQNNRQLLIEVDKLVSIYEKLNHTGDSGRILIDELEIFYETENKYKKDLQLVRDLIRTVQIFNTEYKFNNNVAVQFICAIRTEVLNSMSSRIAAKEINKIVYSNSQELNWLHRNDTEWKHPIIRLWINRIRNLEKEKTGEYLSDEEIKNKWFDNKIHGTPIVSYILHRTWYRPRDIIRFIQAAKNNCSQGNKFDNACFVSLSKEYSRESWKELVEELNSEYTPDQISEIRQLLVGFKAVFTVNEIKERSKMISTFLNKNLNKILNSLYRVGIIGNISKDGNIHLWHHKGDEQIILFDEVYNISIHSAIRSELSCTVRESFKKIIKFQNYNVGDHVKCTVQTITKNYVLVIIDNIPKPVKLSTKLLIDRSEDYKSLRDINIDDIFVAKIVQYNNDKPVIEYISKYESYMEESIDELIKTYS